MKYSSYSLGVIIPNKLYLSSASVANDRDFLIHNNITHIINLTGFTHGPNQIERYPDVHTDIITYLHLHVNDSLDTLITDIFNDCFSFIENALNNTFNKVLVHCEAGISRSASVIIGYLMYSNKLTLKEAYYKTISAKKNIAPNKSFWQQLQTYEQQLFSIPEPTLSLNDYLCEQVQFITGPNYQKTEILKALEDSSYNISLAVTNLLKLDEYDTI
ncbi:protein-tyrosine-phosphatase [Entamoeba marina]